MNREFTATTYILQDNKVLLIFHRKLQKWLPPGGHVLPSETPQEAALREAQEETGLKVELIAQENIWIDRWNAKSLFRPYLCLLEEIPRYGDQPAHQHIDFIYLARPLDGKEIENEEETEGLRWFSLEEIEKLSPDEEIFVETQQTIRHLLSPCFKPSSPRLVPV